MREGLFDVLPAGALDGPTAEDFRLLVNGVGDINVSTLVGYTSFNDESGESNDRLVTFKRWLWAVIEKMTPLEKQDLVYFWTGKIFLNKFLLYPLKTMSIVKVPLLCQQVRRGSSQCPV